ncbi:MAG: hypothetical protein DME44_04140 [Verrucomicrobia bacterium]|nr:MAG: hypothetical protein DME44_04140 [Verrucomicrobiota bacterium]
MTKLRWIVFVALLAISGNSGAQTTSPSVASPQTVRVAFWNIQWFPGRHPNASVASERTQIVSVHRDIRRINADVIGMEEVRDFDNGTIAVSPLPGFKVDVVSDFPPRMEHSSHRVDLPLLPTKSRRAMCYWFTRSI